MKLKHILSYKFKWSSQQIIIMGFLVVILIGSLLLMLPVSSRQGEVTSFSDTLFTATSATCVTGLIVQDTATYWSEFGQFVILILIQTGGIGVVTIAVLAAAISGKKIGLMQRSTMQEAISAPSLSGVVRMAKFILKITLAIEAIGAVIMYPVFCRDFGYIKGLWYAVFHSVSAFCNAGFDLMGGRQKFSSITMYESNYVINIAIMLLIIVGGIGFFTWDDIKTNKWRLKRYRLQSKIVLMMTTALIVIPTIFFFFYEFGTEQWGDMKVSDRFMASLFQAVTPRTAGFNTVDLSKFSEPGILVMIILMLTGGSPGSTAGGMKTTTVAVLIMTSFAVFSRKENAECFGRRVANETIRHAVTIFLMYIALFITGGLVISCIEELPILTCLYETASAIGTVGLTLGITPNLSAISRIILIVLMYMGRVGGLTLVYATFTGVRGNVAKLPKEKITVG